MNANTNELCSDDLVIPESALEQLERMLQTSRYWDGYQLALQIGPLENWSGALAKLLGGRLARHLGSSKLYWRMTVQACREMPGSSRFQAQRVYAVIERRGMFSGWIEAQKLASTHAETAAERAEALVCRADCHLFFRDFETAGRVVRGGAGTGSGKCVGLVGNLGAPGGTGRLRVRDRDGRPRPCARSLLPASDSAQGALSAEPATR